MTKEIEDLKERVVELERDFYYFFYWLVIILILYFKTSFFSYNSWLMITIFLIIDIIIRIYTKKSIK